MRNKRITALMGVALIGISLAGRAIAGFADVATSAEAMMQAAAPLYRNGDLASTTTMSQRGVTKYPKSAQLHFMLGNAYFLEERWLSAADEYEKSARVPLRITKPAGPALIGALQFTQSQTSTDKCSRAEV